MREIRLEDRFHVENIRTKYNHELSSHAFVNLFIWQKQMGLKIDFDEDCFFVKTSEEGENTFFYPCGTEAAQIRFVEEHLNLPDFHLVYLREQDKAFLEQHFSNRFQFSTVPQSDEYIFEREALDALKGQKYANVRNQMNRLHKQYEIHSSLFREEDTEEVIKLFERESQNKHIPGYNALVDDGIAQLAMKYRNELGLYIVTVWVNDKLSGITLGFPLTEDTMDGCIERHDSTISGLSYYTQKALILQAPQQYQYMNAEEDLGLPGLRTMKQHLNPCRMNTIWEARTIV